MKLKTKKQGRDLKLSLKRREGYCTLKRREGFVGAEPTRRTEEPKAHYSAINKLVR